LIGRTLGHYSIIEQIGAGGMGVVYRARDERLERDVALKVLPAGLLNDETARGRFRKEARALAKLNHPHIGTVYDFDTQDGVDFLVMEYIAGTTLDGKLASTTLTEREVLILGAQIALALEEAHERGVVHRDLKPGNIMVNQKGRAKVLDFGLAGLFNPQSDATAAPTVTEARVAAGTLPYMAPEQLRGESVDARTDIHALGAVLYEMATSRRPYQEDVQPRLIDAILNRAPAPPRARNPQISEEFERIVLKCLEKEPDRRYQSAKEVATDLERLKTPPVPVPERHPAAWRPIALYVSGALILVVIAVLGFNAGGLRERLSGANVVSRIESLAVLPLENLSRDAEQEYFADGMTDALIAELSKISALKVISRTSVMQYKGAKKPLRQIAHELGVDGVIEGSVLRENNQVRITVQLIQGATDQHVWANSYQQELRSILALQSDVARAVAREIKVKLTPQEEIRLASAREVDREAYDAYLRGRYYGNRVTEEAQKKSIEYLEMAVRLDPNYALAHARLAQSYATLGGVFGFLSPRDYYPKAKAAAIRALEIDNTLAEAHASLAEATLKYDWNWPQAEREYRRAIELNPSYAEAHLAHGTYLESLGRFVEAIAERKRAFELDPLSAGVAADVGYPMYYAGKHDQAVHFYRSALELDPSFFWAHLWIGQAWVQKGMYPEAIAEIKKAVDLSGRSTRPIATLGHAYAMSGQKAEAYKLLNELQARSKQKYVSPYYTALIYAGLGEIDQAFEYLEQAFEERQPYLVLVNVEPVFANLRSDQRFHNLLRRIGLP
jgi:serine/threonine-protein kinase